MLWNDGKPVLEGRVNKIWNPAAWGSQDALQPFPPDFTFSERVSRVSGQHILHESSPRMPDSDASSTAQTLPELGQ